MFSGAPSPDGKSGWLMIRRSIEVRPLPECCSALSVVFIDDGKSEVIGMECDLIGAARLSGAAVEQSDDERGVCWPRVDPPPF